MSERKITRRRALQWIGLGTALLAACRQIVPASVGSSTSAESSHQAGTTPAHAPSPGAGASRAPNPEFRPDAEIAIRATPAEAQLFDGRLTQVWRYQTTLQHGKPDMALDLPDSAIGPVIRARKGQKLRVHFTNDLPAGQESVIHWHGLHLPEDMDGHPRYAILPGESYACEFEVADWARTAWFHPHPHQKTAEQVYNGLAGVFIVSDDDEQRVGLPAGAFDIPLVIQDRVFDRANQLVYLGRGMMGGPMERLMGFLGDVILVNGRPDATLEVAARPYRLRVLNGSNARIYKLAWSDGAPLAVIGTDGGLLERPVTRNYVMLAPGERVELWADFGGRAVGDEVWLESQFFFGAEDPAEEMKRMHGGAMHGAHSNAAALGALMKLLRIRVTQQAAADEDEASPALPTKLATMSRYNLADAVNANRPRVFELKQIGMRWTINGREWEGLVTAPDERVRLDTTEVWEVVNAISPDEPMHRLGMAHPFHVHGAQFLVLERRLEAPELKPGYETVREGFVNEGWKDTVLVMPGERVRLLMHFSKHTGLFVYHCHNLEHEDMGMMRNYEVSP